VDDTATVKEIEDEISAGAPFNKNDLQAPIAR
jgi:hypothetical protein